MKNILRIIMLLMVCQLTACKDDGNEKSEKQLKIQMLTATSWSHAEVTHSDGDLSDQYTDFTIEFTANSFDGFDGTFEVTNGGYAFEESAGHWRFNDELDQIIFDSEKTMDFLLDEEHLQLDFTVADPGGKVTGMSGHFVFSLQPL